MRSPATDRAINPRGLLFENTVAHRIAASLKRHGVSVVFGQSLPSMVHLAGKEFGIRQIAYRQENTGGYMADGYARMSGKVGVVTAQNGPAAALLVAPLAEALKASIPIVALVQDVSRDQTDRNAFQELDHESMFRPVTKWVRRVIHASRIDDYVDMAFTAATSGRPGPAVLMLPADLLLEPSPPVKLTPRTSSLGTYPLDRQAPDSEILHQAAEMIANAERPVVIAGGGVHSSGAASELARLQEIAHLPIATTVMGKGATNEQHPLSMGVASYFMGHNGSTRFMRSLITEADVVILVGNRTNQNGTDSWQLYPSGARYIHIDIDPQEIGRNYDALRLVGDALLTLKKLTDELEKINLVRRQQARASIEKTIAQAKASHEAEVADLVGSDQSPVRPERVMREIDRRLTDDSVVVADASYSSIWIANYMVSKKVGARFLTPRGLAGLGWGLPMAMGAKTAKSDSTVFCVVGDGGFAHAWAELETAVRMKIKLVLIVLNNGILGYQKHAENIKFGNFTDACEFVPVDHAAIARAVGANGIRVEDATKLGAALDDAVKSECMTVIDVITDPNAFPPVTWYEAN
ncbi:acetolactate synthase catalytic subunit [Orrella sp. NBD-18]|uniref:Acetolactate synthase catalytic subunit n=1 Tax=Sheuella amnicola TaxID=2707330 RepID=A0A6B2QVR4_9BURK|nr:acetolactate synthase catalytic subunit [Sheuella amnicola]NDY81738.1 acetolactate synthase catalytic subunit [Sheuella amnicola]HBI84415.1 acetolactate synthase catalytic subunit [Alcaligenaceae bacterium]